MSQVQILHRAFTLVPTDCTRYGQTPPTHRTLFLRRWARYTTPLGLLSSMLGGGAIGVALFSST